MNPESTAGNNFNNLGAGTVTRSNNGEGGEPATKADVAPVKADVTAVRSEMAAKIDMAVTKLEFKIEDSINVAKQEMIEHMDKKFGEYIDHVDAVFGEIKTSREEQSALAQHSQDHSDRLDDHEKRIGKLETGVGGRV